MVVPEFLRAYWRMEYITAPKDSFPGGNPFVHLPHWGDDRRALIVYRNKYNYLLLNKFPYNPGHLLAVPYRAAAHLNELSVEERADLMETIVIAQDLLTRALRPDGFNTGFYFGAAAGAGIPVHLHGHIVPRWQGDSNFMPVLGGVRILPEALEATWEKLRAHLPPV